jgi:hypothetical protein
MKARFFRLFALLLAMSILLFSFRQAGIAKHERPPQDPRSEHKSHHLQDQVTLPLPAAVESPATAGGPDDFGYTWDSSVAYSWIDAKSLGTNTNLYGGDVYQGPVEISFPFKFYENTYTQLYFSTKGLVSFGEGGYWYSNTWIPRQTVPNNYIAVFWDDLGMYAGSRPDSGIFLYSGGTAPNRYFVIEWHRADFYSGASSSGNQDGDFTFEIILHENGDIVTQYQSLTGSITSSTVGIEDSLGIDGLQFLANQSGLSNNLAVRFFRPAPAARIQLSPLIQGHFSRPGEQDTYRITARNTGELGPDTYDLAATSNWPLILFAADGMTPLVDTDGDGVIDTGAIPQASSVDVFAKVQAPSPGNAGDFTQTTITATSSLNTAKNRSVSMQSALPAPFIQGLTDEDTGAVNLDMAQTASQQVKNLTPDGHYGFEPAVVQAPNGNVLSVWYAYEETSAGYEAENIEYRLVNHFGEVLRPITRLTNHRWATGDTYDFDPVVAVAPDGRFGVLWLRELYKYENSLSQYNYNVYFAVLDADGKRVYGPQNLTSNNVWFNKSSGDRTTFSSPTIAATGDNRFVLAWQKSIYNPSCTLNDCYINDLYLAARASDGSQVTGVIQFTQDTTGSSYEGYNHPSLAQISNNRVLFTWLRETNGINYAVLSSSAGVIKDKSTLFGSTEYGRYLDAVQLSDGKVIVAWSKWTSFYQTRFAIFDSNINLLAGPTTLNNPAAVEGENYVSLAADQAGRAILTTRDSNRTRLYYALVNSSGNVLTPPMAFYYGAGSNPDISINYYGFANTSFNDGFDPGADGLFLMANHLMSGVPGALTALNIHYTNHGLTACQAPSLTLNLPAGLAYVSDTSGITPVVNNDTVSWSLPNLEFLEERRFQVIVQMTTGALIGTRYPVSMNLSVNGEVNPVDNVFNADMMAARQLFMPWTVQP